MDSTGVYQSAFTDRSNWQIGYQRPLISVAGKENTSRDSSGSLAFRQRFWLDINPADLKILTFMFRLDTGGQLQITENGHIIVFCYFFHSCRSFISAGNEPGAMPAWIFGI